MLRIPRPRIKTRCSSAYYSLTDHTESINPRGHQDRTLSSRSGQEPGHHSFGVDGASVMSRQPSIFDTIVGAPTREQSFGRTSEGVTPSPSLAPHRLPTPSIFTGGSIFRSPPTEGMQRDVEDGDPNRRELHGPSSSIFAPPARNYGANSRVRSRTPPRFGVTAQRWR